MQAWLSSKSLQTAKNSWQQPSTQTNRVTKKDDDAGTIFGF